MGGVNTGINSPVGGFAPVRAAEGVSASPVPVETKSVTADQSQDSLSVSKGMASGLSLDDELTSYDKLWLSRPGIKEDGFQTDRASQYLNAKMPEGAQKAAEALVAANQPLENQELANFSPTQQKQYAEISSAIASNPSAHAALQILLGKGELTRNVDSRGKTLLDNLDHMATEKLTPGIDRGDLLGKFIQELAEPTSISQVTMGTCAAASVQMLLANENPSELTRLVGDLASTKGTSHLADGTPIHRLPGSENDHSGRTVSSALFQDAMSNAAKGGIFSSHKDLATKFEAQYSGPTEEDVAKLVSSETKMNYVAVNIDDDWKNSIDYLTKLTQQGYKFPVGMEWKSTDPHSGRVETGGHSLLITKIANGQVYLENPWGEEDSMSLDEFKKRNPSVALPE